MLDIVAAGRIPVVAGVAPDVDGTVYNINADSAAAALAAALGAAKLVVLTDVEGLYANWPDPRVGDQRAHRGRAGADAARPGQRHGAEDGGLPARGARRRAAQAHVIDGRVPHSVLLEVFTTEGVGTMVVPVT